MGGGGSTGWAGGEVSPRGHVSRMRHSASWWRRRHMLRMALTNSVGPRRPRLAELDAVAAGERRGKGLQERPCPKADAPQDSAQEGPEDTALTPPAVRQVTGCLQPTAHSPEPAGPHW